jgi:diadenosine tetraphosphate (Ap4A) HIT family hydrolase
MTNGCTFCDQETIGRQEIVTLNSIRVLYPRRPIIPASVLITPVRCVEHVHDLSDEEINDIFSVVKKLQLSFQNLYNTSGYNFFANDGAAAGQHITHVHFHFYGRSVTEKTNPFAVLNDKDKYDNRPTMSEEVYLGNIKKIRDVLLNLE